VPDYRVQVILTAVDETAAPTQAAQQHLKGVDTAAKDTTKSIEGIGQATVKLSEGVPHLNSFKSALADIGKTAAGFAIGTLVTQLGQSFSQQITSSIDATKEFYGSVRQLQLIAGGSAEELSSTVAAFERFGVSSQQASMSLGIFARQLEKAPVSIDELGTGLGDNGKPLKGFADTMHDLGVSTEDATGKTRPMLDVFEDAADSIKSLGSGSEATAAAMTLFGRSGRDMLPVLLQGREGIQAAAEEAAKFGMVLTADNMVAIRSFSMAQKDMNEALSGLRLQLGVALMPLLTALAQIGANLAALINATLMPAVRALGDYLGSAFVPTIAALAQLIGSILQPPLEAIVGLWHAVTDALNADTPVAKAVQAVLAGIAGALGTLVVGLIAYEAWTLLATVASEGLAIATAILNAVLDADPIMLVAIALGALVGALVYLYNTVQPVQDILNGFWEALTGDPGALGVVYDVLKSVFGDAFGEWVRPALQWLMDAIPVFKDIWRALLETFDDSGALGIVYDSIRKLFGDAPAEFVQPFLESLRTSIPAFKSWLSDLAGVFGNVPDALGKLFSGDFSGAGTSMLSFVTGLGQKLVQARAGVLTVVAGLMTDILPALYGVIQGLVDKGIAMLIAQFPMLTGPLGTLGSLIDAAFGVLGDTSKGLGELLLGFRDANVGQIFSGLLNTIKPWITVIGKVWDIVKVAWSTWIAPAIQEILKQLPGWLNQLGDWITNTAAPTIKRQLTIWAINFVVWAHDVWTQLEPELRRLWSDVQNWISDQAIPLAGQLLEWAGEFIKWVVPLIPPLLLELAKLYVQLVGWIKDRAGDLASQLGTWMRAFVDWLGPALGEFLPKLAFFLGEVVGWIASHVVDLGNALGPWKDAFVNWLVEVIPQIPGKLAALLDTIKTWITGIGAPSLKDAGQSMGKGFLDGFWNWISTQLPKDLAQFKDFLGQLASNFGSGVQAQFHPSSTAPATNLPLSGPVAPDLQLTPFAEGGWLREAIWGVGPSGTRYLLHPNEYVSPAGPLAAGAAIAQAGGRGGVSLAVNGTSITVNSATGDPQQIVDAIEETLWSNLYAKLVRSMDNRVAGVGAY
jgi:hypothetical protein